MVSISSFDFYCRFLPAKIDKSISIAISSPQIDGSISIAISSRRIDGSISIADFFPPKADTS